MTPFRAGRYIVHRQIGAGGMATVHLGRLIADAGFSPVVAIKRLHASLGEDSATAATFFDEARLAGRIRHPNVVPVFDAVSDGTDRFLVMDYVHGEPLSSLLRFAAQRGELLPLGVVSSIIIDALAGLHAAHEARDGEGKSLELVHRDVSPQNILVGVDGVARLVDFGVAKALGRMQSTRAGEIKGKLAYMPPEQLRGELVTRQSDVYGASVVLWEALTGSRLFARDNEGATIEAILFGDIAPPSRHRPDLPPALDAVILRGLARERSKRWPTAASMADAIRAAAPPLPHSRVGEEVSALSGQRLEERSALLRELEALDVAAFPASRDRAPPPVIATPVKVESDSGSSGNASRRTQRRRWFAIAASAVMVMIAFGTYAAARRHGEPAAVPDASIAAAASAPATSLPTPPAPAPPPSVVASSAPASGSPTSSAPTAASAPTSRTPAPTARPTKRCTIREVGPDGTYTYRPGTGKECP